MLATGILAVTVLILGPGDLSYVDTVSGATRTMPLPGFGAAVFVAPDGRAIVPSVSEDATWVLAEGREVERWSGRLMPMFFDEPDRLWALLPGELVLLSYPERLPLRRQGAKGLADVRAAGVSRDGRLVAAVTGGGEAELWLVVGDTQTVRRVPLPGPASSVAVAAEAELVAAGLETGGVVLVAPELPGLPRRIETPGAVVALGFDGDRKTLLVGCRTGTGGVVVGVRPELRPDRPAKELFRIPLKLPPSQLAVVGKQVLVLCGDRLLVLGRGGRTLERELEAPGARGMAVLPAEVRSVLPAWSDR
ncbi:MAG TPA: hypothetical protein P5234_14930 [Thermoanaerobaculaceae bacterium]|nr:hypothetical protein [Thermoanaerobaculaceae bacterium]HRS17528.1 hypothetical protein [Thermoanaerobaculaceae bacterium]